MLSTPPYGLARLCTMMISLLCLTVSFRSVPLDGVNNRQIHGSTRNVKATHSPFTACCVTDTNAAVAATALWTTQRRLYRDLLRRKRESFWIANVGTKQSTPHQLWHFIEALVGGSFVPPYIRLEQPNSIGISRPKLPVCGLLSLTHHRHSRLLRLAASCMNSDHSLSPMSFVLFELCLTSNAPVIRFRCTFWSQVLISWRHSLLNCSTDLCPKCGVVST